jgi:hypothetical protein
MMWRRRKRSQPSDTPAVEPNDVSRECELFLAGRYAQRLHALHRPIPAWTCLNPLAHGTKEELASLGAGSLEAGLPLEWRNAIGLLAGEILILADDDHARLGALQREVLVPMELRLASEWLTPVTPTELVGLVRRELRSRA